MLSFDEVMHQVLNLDHIEIDKSYLYGGLTTIVFNFNFRYNKHTWYLLQSEKAFEAEGHESIEVINEILRARTGVDQAKVIWTPETWKNHINGEVKGRINLKVQCVKVNDQRTENDEFALILKVLRIFSEQKLMKKSNIKKLIDNYVQKYSSGLSEEAKKKKMFDAYLQANCNQPKSLLLISAKNVAVMFKGKDSLNKLPTDLKEKVIAKKAKKQTKTRYEYKSNANDEVPTQKKSHK